MNLVPRSLVATLAATALTVPLLLGAAPAHDQARDAARDAARLSRELVRDASAESAYRHLERFQAVADASGGNRAAGSAGHEASARYVHDQLEEAGYDVAYEPFDFTYVETLAEKLTVRAPERREIAITAMTYTKSTPEGGITAAVAAVPVDATTGCEPADYASGSVTGKIALIERGGCDFAVKQRSAAAAGAVGAVIYNNADGALSGSLGSAKDAPAPTAGIPTGGITRKDGTALAAAVKKAEAGGAAEAVRVTMDVRQLREQRTTRNVIAETRGGDPARTVMLGAHLDSVGKGPGINDNGSGSAGLLEVALRLAATHERPDNKVRFAWWSAEELGLLGSEAYVKARTPAERSAVALYLNFDMIASPNFAQLVYDGDDSDREGAGPGPAGSAQLERGINDFLDSHGIAHKGADFDGRSDYGPFVAAGIPSGGTFTGAEVVKTRGDAERFGGEAGVAYDACYHLACDDLSNINMTAFDNNIDVIADAVGTYAHDLGPLTAGPSSAPQRP
ncbi:M28 family metallopeptidase [Streptomyces sp. AcH 505]|uniref:M28 family metallopeptidase n=1 Tax=Streptomyces sp. AcH 505 TaxID=352211 RepID=UPI000AEE9C46